MNQNQTTDTNGQVVFNLPEQAYKVRADYLAQQYWSGLGTGSGGAVDNTTNENGDLEIINPGERSTLLWDRCMIKLLDM